MPQIIRPMVLRADGALREGRRYSPDAVNAWIAEQTERWKLVAVCHVCKPNRPLVAEEVQPHALMHVPEHLRPMARDLARMDEPDRKEILDLFSRPIERILAPD